LIVGAESGLHAISERIGTEAPQARPPIDVEGAQQDIQRFVGRFNERVRDCCQKLMPVVAPALRGKVASRWLVYDSAALDIALGKNPLVNLFDLVAYLELCRETVRTYWVAEVFGAQALSLAIVFDQSAHESWELAKSYFDEEQLRLLREAIDDWKLTHPCQLSVEVVRLSEVSALAAGSASGRKLGELRRDFRLALRSANEAVLLGERALYYSQRVPFLLRLHARVSLLEAAEESAILLGRLRGYAVGLGAGLALLSGIQLISRLVARSTTTRRTNQKAS
jgi:hypothetical protein